MWYQKWWEAMDLVKLKSLYLSSYIALCRSAFLFSSDVSIESHEPISFTFLTCFLTTHNKIYTLIYIFVRNSVALAREWMLRDKVQAAAVENFFIVQKSISLSVLAEANVHTHDGSAAGMRSGTRASLGELRLLAAPSALFPPRQAVVVTF